MPQWTADEYALVDLTGHTLTTGYDTYAAQLFMSPYSGKIGGIVPTLTYLISRLTGADVIVEQDNWTGPTKVKEGTYDFLPGGWLYRADNVGNTSSDLGSIWYADLDNYIVCKTSDVAEFTSLLAGKQTPEERLSALYNAGKKLVGDWGYSAYETQTVYSATDALSVDVSSLSSTTDWGRGILDGSVQGDFYMTNKYGILSGLTQMKKVGDVRAPVYVADYGTAYIHKGTDTMVHDKLILAYQMLVNSGISQAVHEYWDAAHTELLNKQVSVDGSMSSPFVTVNASVWGKSIREIYDPCNQHRALSTVPNVVPEQILIHPQMIL